MRKPGKPTARGDSTTTTNTTRKTEMEILRSKVEDLIQKNPDKAAKILSLWITEGRRSASPRKKVA